MGKQGVEGHDEKGQLMMITWLRGGRPARPNEYEITHGRSGGGSWRTLIGLKFRLRGQAIVGEIHGPPGRDRVSPCYFSKPSFLISVMKRESERSGSTRGSPFSQIT